ncbi:gamma-interferon-inducible lysosomal thiol reductase-like isoform X2 [Phalaenopsis equestris]|uniref:gamma-interferon-inducible lysosomal thiol reductase-like isoform X2 n=1 Tax=Phalaenopsis equestris TaxID=78828 RepID=UPI0009E3B248|nr:gamma-interferon-inducible lysosomal thiol reductase-like isoform X2 [Phalaenopsis equestris]
MAPVHRTLLLLFFASAFFLPLSTTSATQKVSLALYYEALCPFCSRFIVLSLSKIFSDGLISIVDLRLVPYGNAVIGPNSTIICQHGPSECFLNTVEACAINSWSDVQKHFSFIYCVENLVIANKYSDWESCFQRTGLDPHPLVNCYNSGHGQEVELQFAAQTNALQPPHRYVPWIIVDGLPLYDDYDNFEKYICKAYRGELPSACRRLPVYLAQQMRPNGAERSIIFVANHREQLATKKAVARKCGWTEGHHLTTFRYRSGKIVV